MSEMIDSEHKELVPHEEKPVVQDTGQLDDTDAYILPEDYIALSKSIGRVDKLLSTENEALVGKGDIDLEESAYLKGRAMLDLDMAGKAVGPENLPSEIVVRLQELQEKLAVNMKLLSTQLNAVKEVSGLLSQVMKDHDSDGTYESLVGSW
ncbi:hypothetical protein PsW64_02492 [Pseudovibrio sp. W64]|jgi:hypothetical protein|uniref:Uncharacterized protein n=1 Tax=Pseudovibrio ascidiaceicola TaxID=285279 RepID=A0A1I4BBS7_9HYPH|nr:MULTISPECIES: hypothetical protein [Pseudovibrio]KZK81902.1 hypothetical protein PsW64_02492 [Pseudovibrio sp. W64]KZL11440.1 hypothetical protein PsAD26_02665 [Pseudovibrio sp. Ad26]SFK65401.1 hypothetical protein SAMN04488518_107230 [Pseudovibrio ascidiaceicola]